MTLGSDEVDSDVMLLFMAASADGDLSTWVTPAMGTWGGATIIDEVVAGVVAEQNGLEERGVHKGCDVVAIESTSNILAASVPNKTTSNCWIASTCRSSAKL